MVDGEACVVVEPGHDSVAPQTMPTQAKRCRKPGTVVVGAMAAPGTVVGGTAVVLGGAGAVVLGGAGAVVVETAAACRSSVRRAGAGMVPSSPRRIEVLDEVVVAVAVVATGAVDDGEGTVVVVEVGCSRRGATVTSPSPKMA